MENKNITYKNILTDCQISSITTIIKDYIPIISKVSHKDIVQFQIEDDEKKYLGFSFLLNFYKYGVKNYFILFDKHGVSYLSDIADLKGENIFHTHSVFDSVFRNDVFDIEIIINKKILSYHNVVSYFNTDFKKEVKRSTTINNDLKDIGLLNEQKNKEKEPSIEITLDTVKDKLDFLYNLYSKKSVDYGNSFFDTLDEFGFVSGLTRVTDKYNRIKQLYKSNKSLIKDESMQDTLIDLATYCVMISCWLDYKDFH